MNTAAPTPSGGGGQVSCGRLGRFRKGIHDARGIRRRHLTKDIFVALWRTIAGCQMPSAERTPRQNGRDMSGRLSAVHSPTMPLLHGRRDDRFERVGMAEDADGASISNGGDATMDLLHYGVDQICVFEPFAANDGSTEVEVSQDALERIFQRVIRRLREEPAGRLGPEIRSRDAERLLGLEMVADGPFQAPFVTPAGWHRSSTVVAANPV